MEHLPQKKENTFLELRKPGVTAIEKRRSMLEIPEVLKKLNSVEKFIFQASTKELISDIPDAILVKKLADIFRFIAKDVGYRIDNEDWKMICTRLFKFLKMYHSNLTLAELPLAFELSATGDLDQFFEKDKDGKPDKNHYQQFNIDYFSKVLKAYKQKQNEVEIKAIDFIPKLEYKQSPEETNYYHNRTVYACFQCFEEYKESNELKLDGLKSVFVWEWLKSNNLVKDPVINEDHRNKALSEYLRKSADGIINKYTAAIVKNEGIESKELNFPSLEIARMESITKCFDKIIKDKIDINKFLNYKK